VSYNKPINSFTKPIILTKIYSFANNVYDLILVLHLTVLFLVVFQPNILVVFLAIKNDETNA